MIPPYDFPPPREPPDALSWLIWMGGAATVIVLILLALISKGYAFPLPAYHLMFQQNGALAVSIEDMTEKECKARAKTFKKSAHAKCVLEIAQREYT